MTGLEIKALKDRAPWKERKTVVFLSDFGYADGAKCNAWCGGSGGQDT